MNPEKYWLNRGKTYFREFSAHNFFERRRDRREEQVLVNFLKTLDFQSVFEVGCGYGRITKLILENFPCTNIECIELSPGQIKIAQRYVNDKRANFVVGRVQDIDFPEGKYDLVIAVTVLMHIPFGEVDIALKKMVKASRKHIVNMDWYSEPGTVLGGYCFAHDCASLYKDSGAQLVKVISLEKKPVYGISFGWDSGF